MYRPNLPSVVASSVRRACEEGGCISPPGLLTKGMSNRPQIICAGEIVCTVPAQAKRSQNIAYFSKRYIISLIWPDERILLSTLNKIACN
jgi:hypothetical protein